VCERAGAGEESGELWRARSPARAGKSASDRRGERQGRSQNGSVGRNGKVAKLVSR